MLFWVRKTTKKLHFQPFNINNPRTNEHLKDNFISLRTFLKGIF